MNRKNIIRLAVISIAITAIDNSIYAVEDYSGGPVVPFDVSDTILPPSMIPGKEYVDNAGGVFNFSTIPGPPKGVDNGQVIVFDGVVPNLFSISGASGVADGVDFYPEPLIPPTQGPCIDAIASHVDTLYLEGAANRVPLLVSHTGDAGGAAPIFYEQAAGPKGVWATKPEINGHDTIEELDGLEVWGPQGKAGSDSDRYSISGDPFRLGGKWSVYAGPGDLPYIDSATLAAAIGLPTPFWSSFDLDALMLFDDGDLLFGNTPGDNIMFSIRPLGPFDGGEVWEWNPMLDGPAAPFLFHGGHLWDTAYPIATTFGVANENIDALEVLPEPTSLAFVSLIGMGLLRRRR